MTNPLNSLKTFKQDYPDVKQYEEAFSPEECLLILAAKEENGALRRDVLSTHDGQERVRDSNLLWLYSSDPRYAWIFERIATIVGDANEKYYQFDLDGGEAVLQLTEYGTEQFYSWHVDLGAGPISRRKLSVSINLSPTDDYIGGDLEFFRSETNILRANRGLGNLSIFPSWMNHQVTPVTSGIRWSAVLWFDGPPFR